MHQVVLEPQIIHVDESEMVTGAASRLHEQRSYGCFALRRGSSCLRSMC